MPALDKTGPQGQGPMTGRGLGPCGKGRGMGFGRCRGYGRGLGRYFGWNAPQTKEEKLEDVEVYKKALQEEMEEVDKELVNLQKQE
ncbi:DUF5320 domain-containing protein [Candidatus Microgenomates bacterium]|nr:DUF5320 domain-containing protein [Candidatus Microgenomates bacterium]